MTAVVAVCENGGIGKDGIWSGSDPDTGRSGSRKEKARYVYRQHFYERTSPSCI